MIESKIKKLDNYAVMNIDICQANKTHLIPSVLSKFPMSDRVIKSELL
jgi:hypothetical protein